MSDSLQSHCLQHTRLPCPSLSPRVCSSSRPLSQWCYLTISSSVALVSFCLQSFPASGSSPTSFIMLKYTWHKIYCLNHFYGEGNGTPLQYSCLENPMDGGAWGLQSMGSQRVGHNWAISLSLFTFLHWRRKWQPTPMFLPGESQGRGNLVGCRLWGRTESDTTEAT